MDNKEKRRFRRIYYSDEDGIWAVIRLQGGPSESIEAKIMNLGEGGAFIVISKDKKIKGIAEGVRLILKEIKGATPLLNIDKTEIEIKWILQAHFLENIGMGCEFINISKANRKKIRHLVASSKQEGLSPKM